MEILWIVVGLLAGAGLGYVLSKQASQKRAGSAEGRANELLADAERQAEALKKEALVEAKDEALRIREEAEKEAKERNVEVQRKESRLGQREETLDQMARRLEAKEKAVADKEAHV